MKQDHWAQRLFKTHGSIVKEAAQAESFKLLTRDERKEMEKLKELLIPMTRVPD